MHRSKSKRCSAALLLTFLALGAPQTTIADERAESAALVGRLGIAFMEEAARLEGDRPPAVTVDEHTSAGQRAMDEYNRMRFAYASAQSGGRNAAALTDTITAGSALVGFVPGVVAGIVLRGATGYGNSLVDTAARKQSLKYLAAVSETIKEELGEDDLTEIALSNREGLEKLLKSQEGLLVGLHKRAAETGDTALIATTAQAIAQAAHDAARQGIKLSTEVAEDISKIDAELTEFMENIGDRIGAVEVTLGDHETRIDGLETSVSELSQSVGDMQTEVERLGGNQDLVVDFVFSRMTLEERASALETGFVDRMISCPKDAPDCNVSNIREALIVRYREEAEYQETISSIAGVLKDAGTILTIAGDLKIDVPPEIARGLEIANSAFAAVTTWSTNPLGAIAAVTGLFGSKKDAGQVRHEQMMNFLAKNFERINEQLVQIQKNQQKILDSVAAVSEQIADMHRDLDGRLTAIQRDMQVIGLNVERVLWNEWSPCRVVFEKSLNKFGDRDGDQYDKSIDPSTLAFLSFDHRVQFANDFSDRVHDCANTVDDAGTAFRSPKNWRQESTFLDLDFGFIQAIGDNSGDTSDDHRSDAQRYIDNIVRPSSAILKDWQVRHGLDRLTMLHILAEQPRDMSSLLEIRGRLGMAPIFSSESTATHRDGLAWRFVCDDALETYKLIAEITCEGRFHHEMAEIYLTAPMSTGNIHNVAKWAVVAAQIADLDQGIAGFALTLEEVAAMSGKPRGQTIIETVLAISTIGVAYEQRLHGGWTALAIAEDILEGRPLGPNHHAILSSNNYLAENVMTILMHRWMNTSDMGDLFPGEVSFLNRYTNAVVYSREQDTFPLDQVHAVFSDKQDRPWKISDLKSCYDVPGDGNRACYQLQTSEGPVLLPLPGPLQVTEGRFAFPRSYQGVVAAREMLIERLIAYELGQGDYVQALLDGLRQP